MDKKDQRCAIRGNIRIILLGLVLLLIGFLVGQYAAGVYCEGTVSNARFSYSFDVSELLAYAVSDNLALAAASDPGYEMDFDFLRYSSLTGGSDIYNLDIRGAASKLQIESTGPGGSLILPLQLPDGSYPTAATDQSVRCSIGGDSIPRLKLERSTQGITLTGSEGCSGTMQIGL